MQVFLGKTQHAEVLKVKLIIYFIYKQEKLLQGKNIVNKTKDKLKTNTNKSYFKVIIYFCKTIKSVGEKGQKQSNIKHTYQIQLNRQRISQTVYKKHF